MKRKTRIAVMAGAVGLFLGCAAHADVVPGLVVTQPRVGLEALSGPRSALTLSVPAGQEAPNRITDNTELRAFLVGLDAETGMPVAAIEVSAGIVGAPINYNNQTGNTLVVDLTNAAGLVAFYNAAVAGGNRVGIVVNTVDIAGANTNGIATAFDADDPAADETMTADTVRPSLVGAFISDDGEAAYFVFSEPLNNGSRDNDGNHTVIAEIDFADLQVDSTLVFDGTELAPTGLSQPSLLAGSNNTVIAFDRDPQASTLVLGGFVRPNFSDAGTTAVHDFYDIVGNRATADAVQVATIDFGIEILAQPDSVLLPASGGMAAFTVEASGFGLSYQWLRDGQPLTDDGSSISGANTPELVITTDDASLTGLYTCRVSSEVLDDSVQSESAVLAFRPDRKSVV